MDKADLGDPSGGYIGYLTKGVTMGGTNAPFSNFPVS